MWERAERASTDRRPCDDLLRAVLGDSWAPLTLDGWVTWPMAWAFCRRLAVRLPVLRPRLPAFSEARAILDARPTVHLPWPEWCEDPSPSVLGFRVAAERVGGGITWVQNDVDAPGALRLFGGAPSPRAPSVEVHALGLAYCIAGGIVPEEEAVAWVDGVLAHARLVTDALIDASLDGDLLGLGLGADEQAALRVAIRELLVARAVHGRDGLGYALTHWDLEPVGVDHTSYALGYLEDWVPEELDEVIRELWRHAW